MKLSQAGIDLIKKFEGCVLTAYKAIPTEKYWTIGYGHYGSDVKQGQVITQAQADELLVKDLQHFVDGVNKLVKTEISQNQFDSLVSFAYNCGLGALNTSTLLKYVNSRQFDKAALEFTKWNKSGGVVLKGLTRRRADEKALFSKFSPFPEIKVAEKSYFLRTGSMSKEQAEKYAKELKDKYGWVVHIGEA